MSNYRYRSQKYGKSAKNKGFSGAKKKKSIFLSFFFWLAVLFFVVFGSLIYFFVFSSFFRVKDIEIYGNSKVAREEIEKIAREDIYSKMFFIIPRNIFFIDFKNTKKIILEKFVQIKKTDFKKRLPASIIIAVEERTALGVWCRENNCFNFDEQGIVFEQAREEGGFIIKTEKEFSLGEKVLEKQELDNILEIKKELENNFGIFIKEFFIPDKQEKLIVRTNENWQIYFNPKEDISDQLFNLKLVLKEKIPSNERENLEYIDLRFGSKVFYRYQSI